MPQETGLYYLQSRYYNPEIGRFINADSLVSTGQGILGYNMFAYCNNNPVNASDPTGHVAVWDVIDVACAGISWSEFIADPSWGGFGSAVFDTIGLLPLIPSVGAVKRAAKVLEKAIDARKATKKGGAALEALASATKGGSSSVDDIVSIMKSGVKTSDGKNIITQLDDSTKAIFRMDVGKNAHSMDMYGYPNPVNHINIEIQVKASSGKYKPKWNYHIILDEFGKVSDSFATGIWAK